MWRNMCARAGMLSLAIAAGSVSLLLSDAKADISLYTTQQDFTGWNGGSNVVATPIATSIDGSSTNGLGNNSSPGGAGTSGGLQVDWTSGNWFAFGGPDSANRANFLAALGSTETPTGITGASGTILMDYTKPATVSGTYFQVGVHFNYDGGWAVFGTASEVDNGNGTFTGVVPYTINDTTASGHFWWWQFGIYYNSDYTPDGTFVIDNIRVQQVPEPASLALISVGGIALIRRRRA